MRYRLALCLFLCCWATALIAASEQTSLSNYLRSANESGLRILFSSELVPSRYTVTFDPARDVSLESVRRALAGFDLELEARGNIWVVRRAGTSEPAVPGPSQSIVSRPPIEELIVTSSHYRMLMRETDRSYLLSHDELHRRPALGNDATRLVNQLPGSASSGVSGRPHVRGGDRDETLVLFDGVRLYNPYHINAYNSLISGFDSRTIDALDFYSGGFPVNYGDRLSAVMRIDPVEPAAQVREVGIGLLTASWLQTGTSPDRGWLVAARRSTIDLIAARAENDIGTPAFADLYASHHWYQDADEYSINLLWFGDDNEIRAVSAGEQSESIEGNTYAWLKWTRDWSDRLTSDSWLHAGAIKSDRKGQVNRPGIVVATLDDSREFRVYGFTQHWSYLAGERTAFEGGWDYRYLEAEYSLSRTLDVAPAFTELSNFTRPEQLSTQKTLTGHQAAVYSSYRWKPFLRLTIEAGLRGDFQHFENDVRDAQFSPRLSVLVEATPSTDIRVGWGRFTQADGVHELSAVDGQTRFNPAERAEHRQIGIVQQLWGVEFKLEAYEKWGDSRLSYYDNLTNRLSLLPELAPDRIRVDANGFLSRGVELSVSGAMGKVNYWANYAYSSVNDEFGLEDTRRSWDQSRALNLGLGREVSGWQMAASFAYHDGWQTTRLALHGGVVVSGDRNGESFGDFSSLDVKASKVWTLGGGSELRLELGVVNLLDHENVGGINYVLEEGELKADQKRGLPLAPFLDLFYRF